MKAYWWKASLFLLALSGYALAQSDAPSLADIARQTREGKKKAALVLSDEDQRFSRSATADTASTVPDTVVASPQSAAAETSPKSGALKPVPPTGAKSAPAASSTKQKLEFYKSELQSWKGIAKRDEELLEKETVPFRQQMYQDALEGDRQTMSFFQQKADEAQKELAKPQPKADSSADTGTASPGGGSQP
jgi:hypothetical protein